MNVHSITVLLLTVVPYCLSVPSSCSIEQPKLSVDVKQFHNSELVNSGDTFVDVLVGSTVVMECTARSIPSNGSRLIEWILPDYYLASTSSSWTKHSVLISMFTEL